MVQKYLSEALQNKNFKISFGFFSLQGTPALLVPWMMHTVVFLIMNIILSIALAVVCFSINDTANGVGNIIVAVICVCK
jgi:hypothetical protein